jgi:eukaryotic-like serine/threonine-protein kinase
VAEVRGEERESEHGPGALGEADTVLAGGATDATVRVEPSDASEPRDAVAQALAHDTIFGRAGEPQQLGRYVVLDTLGEGGMGVVLRAFDRELDRPVALKVLHAHLDESHTARLRREAQAMAKLSHPNVVQVYEVGQLEGRTFVAMELVKGQTPREWMRQEPRPGWRACVRLFIQLGEGLAAAHERGLVHRDFKPANAIIDEKGRARVLDFGLVRHDDDDDAERESVASQRARTRPAEVVPLEASLTKTGAVLGTPAYMPLEQMEGHVADARSDQFSFCASLYEAVYGERPFDGSSMVAMMVAMRKGSPRPAPKGTEVPVALRKVLLRGLAIEPERRWPSMEALLGELRRFAFPRRRRRMVLAVSVGLVAVGGGLGATRALEWLSRCTGARKQLEGAWDETRRQAVQAAILGTELSYAPGTWERVEPRLDAYADAWVAEHTETCEATRVRGEQREEEMSLRMGCLHERWRYLRATVNELSHADATAVEHAVQAVASLPGLERCRDLPALRAEVPPPEDAAVAEQVAALDELLVEARAKEVAGRYEDGLRLADEVVERGAVLGYEPLMARAWLQQGRLREKRGKYEGALEVLRHAYHAALAHTMKAEAAEASARLMLVLEHRLVRHDEARDWTEDAEALSRAVGTAEARVGYLAALGNVAQARAEYEEARDSLERALSIAEEELGPEHPAVAGTLISLGGVANSQGKYEEARGAYERALAIQKKTLGPEHPLVAAALNNLGNLAELQGKYEEARGSYERARVIWEKALGSEHPDVAVAFNNLGNIAAFQGRFDEARDWYARALAIREKALGPDHPHVAQGLASLGNVAFQRAEYEEARRLHERALAIFEKALGPDHPDLVPPLHLLGVIAAVQHRHDDACTWFERALAISEKALGPDHPAVSYPLTDLGESLVDLARPADALAPLEHALIIRTTHPLDPNLVAETRFALARALWAAPAGQGRDLHRARMLAEQARETFAAAGKTEETTLAEVQAWLAEHRLPPTAGG